MIDELRYHDPAKRQIITREAALAAADEIEALRRERDTLALVGGRAARGLHDAMLKLNHTAVERDQARKERDALSSRLDHSEKERAALLKINDDCAAHINVLIDERNTLSVRLDATERALANGEEDWLLVELEKRYKGVCAERDELLERWKAGQAQIGDMQAAWAAQDEREKSLVSRLGEVADMVRDWKTGVISATTAMASLHSITAVEKRAPIKDLGTIEFRDGMDD